MNGCRTNSGAAVSRFVSTTDEALNCSPSQLPHHICVGRIRARRANTRARPSDAINEFDNRSSLALTNAVCVPVDHLAHR